MTFEQADKIFLLIMEAYHRQGYYPTAISEANILEVLAYRQFVISIKNGKVEWFAGYWRIAPEDIGLVKDKIRPADVLHGECVYITEAVNLTGKKGMRQLSEAVRKKNRFQRLCWHRPVKKNQFYDFPRQKGWR